jgi:hypothetical protein
MITILDTILSYFRNPTTDWPEAGKQVLAYDLRRQSINGYCLNSGIELARQFGKCKYVKRLGKEYLDLFYPDSGLILQFASEELMAITAIVSPASFHVSRDKMGVGEMTIIDTSGQNHSLNEATTLKDLVSYLGKPVDSGTVGKDMVHTFNIERNVIDSYHHSITGQLLHVEICETNEADGKSKS